MNIYFLPALYWACGNFYMLDSYFVLVKGSLGFLSMCLVDRIRTLFSDKLYFYQKGRMWPGNFYQKGRMWLSNLDVIFTKRIECSRVTFTKREECSPVTYTKREECSPVTYTKREECSPVTFTKREECSPVTLQVCKSATKWIQTTLAQRLTGLSTLAQNTSGLKQIYDCKANSTRAPIL